MGIQDWLLEYMERCFKAAMAQVYGSPSYLLEPNSAAALLDCGCNNGEFSRRLGDWLGTPCVYGIELGTVLAQAALRRSVRVVCTDLNRPFPFQANSLSVVTAFNLLEHLTETELFLGEAYRVLEPGGYAIINTPNLASWHNIAALLLGLQPFSGPNISSMTESDLPIVRRMHRRAYQMPEEPEYIATTEPGRHRHLVVVAFRALTKALARAGFTVEEALGFGYYPLPPFLARVASRVDPAHAHHMVIKARKPLSRRTETRNPIGLAP
jgi:SAM-dependent methyltransferase